MTDTEVIVVGAGVAGAASAWALARRGVRVTLLEQYDPANPWGASHGRARLFRLANADPLYVRLARAAYPLWRELEAAAEISLLTVTGGIDHGSAQPVAALAASLRAAGEDCELLPAAQAGRRWPGLVFDGDVLHHPRSGRLDAQAAVWAFVTAARAAGAEVICDSTVHRLEVADDRTVRLHLDSGPDSGPDSGLDSGTVSAQQVVVAAGAWTAAVLAGTVSGLPDLAVSQEQPVLFAPIDAPWPGFVHHGPPGLPTTEAAPDVYGLGGTEGITVGRHGAGRRVDPRDHSSDSLVVDEAELSVLTGYAARWMPGVDTQRSTTQHFLSTRAEDGEFVVGRSGPITVATGFDGCGFTFGPVVGELVARQVLGPGADGSQPVSERLAAAALRRFAVPRPIRYS